MHTLYLYIALCEDHFFFILRADVSAQSHMCRKNRKRRKGNVTLTLGLQVTTRTQN